MKTLFVTDPVVDGVDLAKQNTSDNTPLYAKVSKIGGGSVRMSEWQTHRQVLESGSWPFMKKLIASEYFET